MSLMSMSKPQKKISKSLDEYLDEVDYSYLNSNQYVPSVFSLNFLNFIKAVNGSEGETHKSPPLHYAMIDTIEKSTRNRIVNLQFRGSAKTTVMAEYFFLYIAVFGGIPKLPSINGSLYIADSMDNGAKMLRDNLEFRYNNSDFLQMMIPKVKFTEKLIDFTNRENHMFTVKLFGATSGIRGTKIRGKRPSLAVIDDLISDEAEKSKTIMTTLEDTIYRGVIPALDPTKSLVIMNGTPFHKEDVMVKAVESGAWDVNVFPVCEQFPCSKEEFRGAWEDRFSYDTVYNMYTFAVENGREDAFNQEYMLRLSSVDERLIQDEEIRWYSRASLLANRGNYNFYITTDFATSSKQTADFSVISVWAYSANGDWLWVDGHCQRTTMDVNVNKLFELVQEYRPLEVGIEVTGQQGGFIPWLTNEMVSRNIWFNFASSGSSRSPGIRPTVDKLTRLNVVVPWFKAGKVFFPEELRKSSIIGEFLKEIRLATINGIKGKDDCLDTISMLQYINAWKPSIGNALVQKNTGIWEDSDTDDSPSTLSSYIV